MTGVRIQLLEQCAALHIVVPEVASKKQIEALINEYYEAAAIITTEEGLRFRQTDKPTAEYYIEFTISASVLIRAESEEVACKWVENEDPLDYQLRSFEYLDSRSPEIIACNKVEEDS